MTDDDLHIIAGRREQLIGRLQERYGIAKEVAAREADEFVKALTADEEIEQRANRARAARQGRSLFSVVEGSRRRETGPEPRTPGLFRDKEGRERNTKMKRSAIPGLLLALIGIVLFAHQDLARVMQKRTEVHASRVQRNAAALKAEQEFPLASLLAGFFFMSGIGLVAVTAHPVGVPAGSQRKNPDTQVEETV